MKYLKTFCSDARHFQILTLASLLGILFFWSDFAPEPEVIVMIVVATITTQFLFYKFLKIPSGDYRSPLITSLSLCLLFKTSLIWIYPLAGVVAMAGKFLIRYNGKHIFNPANGAIVAGLMFLPDHVWVSPGQWGSTLWLGFLLFSFALLVLSRAKRADMSVFFLASWCLLLFARALWLGDPLTIPLHNIQSGAILIFAFFMISDPMTTPDHRWGRFLFAFAVAVLAYVLQYKLQIREGLFFALFIISMITPFIDRVFKNQQYQWRYA